MEKEMIQHIKDKLQCDLEQCIKDKGDLKKEGLFSQSDVILGRETEIRELLEYIEEIENPTITEKQGNHVKIESIVPIYIRGELNIHRLPVSWEIYPICYKNKKYVLEIKKDIISVRHDIFDVFGSIYEYSENKKFLVKHKRKLVFRKKIRTLDLDEGCLYFHSIDEEYFLKLLPQITKSIFKEWEKSLKQLQPTKALEIEWDGIIEKDKFDETHTSEFEENFGRAYVQQTGKCPMCVNCPHNCPLDNKN